ncbi:dirigent protein 1-like [Andrographis paniculata]|uniref:dirigent protein 1-like n=1 Tax=Andrographis paniculata TaxID=175694 RepID=UPI0021E8659B|nr:dirigent protein 1-like [Andrographis paniculata]
MEGLLFIVFLLFTISTAAAVTTTTKKSDNPSDFFETLSRWREKSTGIRYYVHSTEGGSGLNIYEVAWPSITANSPTQFGLLRVSDATITANPDKGSPGLGRVQGMLVSADMREVALALTLNVVFTAGLYNGSTLSAAGRNSLGIPMGRELPIVGGTGRFRLAWGSFF